VEVVEVPIMLFLKVEQVVEQVVLENQNLVRIVIQHLL